jgi:hypothetical protein
LLVHILLWTGHKVRLLLRRANPTKIYVAPSNMICRESFISFMVRFLHRLPDTVRRRRDPRELDLLRHGTMAALFGGVRAPSTLGSFLRTFTWGNVAAAGEDEPVGAGSPDSFNASPCASRALSRAWPGLVALARRRYALETAGKGVTDRRPQCCHLRKHRYDTRSGHVIDIISASESPAGSPRALPSAEQAMGSNTRHPGPQQSVRLYKWPVG